MAGIEVLRSRSGCQRVAEGDGYRLTRIWAYCYNSRRNLRGQPPFINRTSDLEIAYKSLAIIRIWGPGVSPLGALFGRQPGGECAGPTLCGGRRRGVAGNRPAISSADL